MDDASPWRKVVDEWTRKPVIFAPVIFAPVFVATTVMIRCTMGKSKGLSDCLDALSNPRMSV